ncbi:uncharacterized protein LOC131855534 [Achroia grisella]|uniref:uncharacterized protein LOC131855534 n=1 Tax=Achroia grisella TaxID=688607 RepID=UPI0027D234BD|nr:uncharacterized protein LOC131855534 [Achroia grisella]
MFNTPPRDKIISYKERHRLTDRLECASEHVLAKDTAAVIPPRSTVRSNISLRGEKELFMQQNMSSQRPLRDPSVTSSKASEIKRKQLELEAARAKAKIQLDLIDKELEANLAIITDGSRRSIHSSKHASVYDPHIHSHVEDWLEQSNVQPPCNADQELNTAPMMQAVPATDCPQHSRPAPVNGEDSILQLAHTLKDMMVNSSSHQDERLLTRLATPRELPTYFGDCMEWLHFKSAYMESTRVCQFSDSENLWRLRRALRGDAKEAVTDLLIGNTSPGDIISALELRFGRSDIIIHHVTTQIKKLPSLPTHYQQDIVNFSIKINNCIATLNAMNLHDYLRSPELASAISSKLPSILISKFTDYAFDRLTDDTPKLMLYASFLKREAEMTSALGLSQPREQKKPDMPTINNKRTDDRYRYNYNKQVFTTTTINESKLCRFCNKSQHLLPDCRLFRRAMRKDRWNFVKNNKLCYCCLLARHDRMSCAAPVCNIDDCGLAHHTLLHYRKPIHTDTQPVTTMATSSQHESSSTDATVAYVNSATDGTAPGLPGRGRSPTVTSCDVILKVVKVKLSGPNGTVSTYALLDDGASISMIDSGLVNELGLKSLSSSSIKLIDAFGLEVYQSDAPKVCLNISGYDNCNYNKCNYNITLRNVSKLKLPMQNLSVINNIHCDYLSSVKQFVCTENVVPRLLIGEDNYFLLAPLEILHGNKYEPYATRCRLGWSIHGSYGRTNSSLTQGHSFHVTHNDEVSEITILNNLVKNSFELDCIGISTLRRENTADLRAVNILDQTARNIGNRWEVGLPFIKDVLCIPDSYNYALSRLNGLLRKFKSDSAYADRYKTEMHKLFDNGYARVLKENELVGNRIWYLCHFGVLNPNKPSKLRLVFDGAGKVNGLCLNDFLLTGPDLYNSLLGIMLRFREHKYVIVGDIKDMFLRIRIRAEDQHLFRFLWREDDQSPLKICVMQSLVFGATCSPFIAQHIKNKNALKYEDLYPEAVDVIINNHYMDDCLYSCDSEEKAIKLVREITEIHSYGGFEIGRWSSNSKPVLNTIPHRALTQSAVDFKHGANNTTERTLGLMWYPNDDAFAFKISFNRIPQNIINGTEPPTKSQMLSILMSVYDIHGFLAPCIIKGKILFQSVHRSGVDWKCHIQPTEFVQFTSWLCELKKLDSLRIPRCYINGNEWTFCYNELPNITCINNNFVDIQLHTFCDASTKAYAAVSYWRLIRSDCCVQVSFVGSKSRVSPLRPISIPRLELQGAVIAARLANIIETDHKDFKPAKRYFWTDSSTVLQWIRSDPRNYKPFVAHRLGEIDELTKNCEWRHVPSDANVADVATRDDASPLSYSDPWFQGPAFLRRPESEWPKDRKFSKTSQDVTCEERSINVVMYSSELSLPSEDNISNWITLVRATARVLLFINKCRRKNIQFDVSLMKRAEILLIKKCQQDSFSVEISCLQQNKPIMRNSRLLKLSPYLDETGVLRVGGRIDRVAGVELSTLRPAILDGGHRITRLLVYHHHKEAMHGSNELVVNQLRQQYWILKLRPTVRTVSTQCLTCRSRRAAPQPQRMADLPAARLQHNRRPFSYTGVDFFGPIEVTVCRRRQKRYCMLFTCLTVRAIHMELTEDLSSDSAIMALRRMGARRGLPLVIYSDNGTNLRGADSELKRSIAELNTKLLCDDGTIRGVEWRFIPPGAPEMGGAWERMIRTVKTALKVTLKERAPHPDTLATILTEVEALVNSRPITHVSLDPDYPEALTPNHFLIGTPSSGPTYGLFNDSDLCLRKRWRIAQRITDMFWSRWIKEYLPTLLPRQKWMEESRSLQVGDYVVVVDPKLDRGCWRHGVVSSSHTGEDGRVRVVDVRTRAGLLRRPVTRVALLSPASVSSAN